MTASRRSTVDRIAGNPVFDRVARPIRNATNRVIGSRQGLKDALHGVWLGHPLHPALVQLPVGSWLCAAMLDLGRGKRPAATALIGVGVATAVPTAAAGLTDYSALHQRQQRVGVVHAACNSAALVCYTASLIRRLRTGHRGGRLLGLLGLTMVGAGAKLGGDLTYRLAAGPYHAEDVPYVTPEGWHPVCRTEDLREGEPQRVLVGDVPVMLLRRGEEIHALADECAHLSGPLHEGSLLSIDGELCVSCPWHGSTFRISDGAVAHGPATAPQPVFDVRVLEGRVHLRAPVTV